MSASVANQERKVPKLSGRPKPQELFGLLLIGCAIAWCFGPDLLRLSGRWWQNPDYIHGFLVIPFACFLAWSRRGMLADHTFKGSWWGLLFIGLSVAMQCASAYLSDPILSPLAMIPSVAGVALLVGGWRVLKWLTPSILMLVSMIPLPNFMESWGNLVLQRISTVSSTFALQTLGIPAASFGNVIVLTDTELGVEEACAGLRSTVLFLAVSTGAALMIKGTPERIAVILSAVPAAVVANIVRIVATGLLYQYATAELAEAVFHDFFGFLMLPLAAGMVWGVVNLTRLIFVDAGQSQPLGVGGASIT